MTTANGEHPDTESRLNTIRKAFEKALPKEWTHDAHDREAWLTVLRPSLSEYLNNEGNWTKAGPWVKGLSKSVARLSVALSNKDGKKVERRALILAAVLVSGACHQDPGKDRLMGPLCSRVRLENFDPGDNNAARDLYNALYSGSGLPVDPPEPSEK